MLNFPPNPYTRSRRTTEAHSIKYVHFETSADVRRMSALAESGHWCPLMLRKLQNLFNTFALYLRCAYLLIGSLKCPHHFGRHPFSTPGAEHSSDLPGFTYAFHQCSVVCAYIRVCFGCFGSAGWGLMRDRLRRRQDWLHLVPELDRFFSVEISVLRASSESESESEATKQ